MPGADERMRQPGGPGHEATLAAIARFGAEMIPAFRDDECREVS